MGKQKVAGFSISFLSEINPLKLFWGFVCVFSGSTIFYFWIYGNHIFFFQENQSLFLYSKNYLFQYLDVPGGMLQYLSTFAKQFYVYPFVGALIISIELVLLILILRSIALKLNCTNEQSWFVLFIPSSILFFLHTISDYYLYHSLGFLFVMFVYNLFLRINTKYGSVAILIFFPFLYYLLGGFMWILFGLVIIYHSNIFAGKQRFFYILGLIAIVGSAVYIFVSFLSVQPVDKQLFNPFDSLMDLKYVKLYIILILYLLAFPKIVSIPFFQKKNGSLTFSLAVVILLFISAGIAIYKNYDPKLNQFMKLEKLVYTQNWEDFIKEYESREIEDKMLEHYYFVALSEKGILCDRMFMGNPKFGVESLIIPWEYNPHIINRGVYFYYSIGLMNESHRWAFESMTTQGIQPENLKLIVKTNLVNGHFEVAHKYICILKQTLFYRDWALRYEKIYNNPKLIKDDPELSEKIRLLPKTDFFINVENPAANLAYLLKANNFNKKAFEYGIAWALLSKNMNAIANELPLFGEMGYLKFPRHVEEAAMILQSIRDVKPDQMGGLRISDETKADYANYVTAYKKYRQSTNVKSTMATLAGNSFWYYMHFQ